MTQQKKRSVLRKPLPDETPFRMTLERSANDNRRGAGAEVSVRAYEIFVERGGQPGDDVGDWLRAEREYYERATTKRGPRSYYLFEQGFESPRA